MQTYLDDSRRKRMCINVFGRYENEMNTDMRGLHTQT